MWGPVIGAVDPGPAERDVAGRARQRAFRASRAWSTGSRSSSSILLAPEGVLLARARSSGAAQAARSRDARCATRANASRRRRERASLRRRATHGAHRSSRCAACRNPSAACKAVRGRELRGARRRDPRHHRPERRRQDHAVQSAERLHRGPTAGSVRFEGQRPGRPASRTASAGSASAARSRSCAPFARMSVLQNVVVGALVRDARRTPRRCEPRAGRARARRARARARDAAPAALTHQAAAPDGARARARRRGRSCCCSTRRSPGSARRRSRSCSTLIRSLAADGITIVIIEHTMQAMVRLADASWCSTTARARRRHARRR